ncbi:MAG TPA: TetR family transcriptional regulator [Solirubrobacteraceae bacterium]|jgi:AcrR family transcriptional regulator/DNA-binding MarR family transcriptional regulator
MGEELQRARILRALAEELTAREDLHAVTVAHIAARAGVSRRVFYEHYTDREDCFLGAFEWGLARAGDAMYTAYARESRWDDGVRMALAELLAAMEEEPALARLCVVYALGAGRRVLERRMQALAVLREFVDRGRLESSGRAEPPEVAAEGAVGAVLSVLHTRLLSGEDGLLDLLGPLMSVILLPYMGAAKAGRELARPAPRRASAPVSAEQPPTAGLGMRLTYRTTRVLCALAECPGACNREVADRAGIVDQGQISRLLARLESLGLIANEAGEGDGRALVNAWVLTPRGEQVERSIQTQARLSRSEDELGQRS